MITPSWLCILIEFQLVLMSYSYSIQNSVLYAPLTRQTEQHAREKALLSSSSTFLNSQLNRHLNVLSFILFFHLYKHKSVGSYCPQIPATCPYLLISSSLSYHITIERNLLHFSIAAFCFIELVYHNLLNYSLTIRLCLVFLVK